MFYHREAMKRQSASMRMMEAPMPTATTTAATTARRRPRAVFLSLPVHQWMQVAAERRRLAQLDDAALKDLGLEREQAAAEARRPFWNSRPR